MWQVQLEEGEDEKVLQAAQQEAATGVDRECALLQSRLRLLATHALVRTHPLSRLCCPTHPCNSFTHSLLVFYCSCVTLPIAALLWSNQRSCYVSALL